MKGFINVIKPSGITSAGVVGIVKRKLNCTCGHMGTLDPMASGVLPIGLEKTSRLFQFLIDKDKTYVASFRFGILTDTLDITGKTLDTTSIIPKKEDIEKVLSSFIGDIEQIPPSYSAKCVDGKRGYELARLGKDFTLSARKVHIENIKLLEQTSETDFKFSIDCKGGTYIRSIARDLGYKLNSLCTMTDLIRTKSGIFNMENGITLEDFKIAENIEKYIIRPEEAVNFESITLTAKQAERLLNGLYDDFEIPNGLYKVFNEKEFWGVGEVKDKKIKMRSYVRE